MKINEIIKIKRLEKQLTQEGLAAMLGVSAPAVNKWEKGTSYPDITLLPVLARILGTDLNTLLSFEEDMSKEEITNFINEVSTFSFQHSFKETLDKVKHQIFLYPNNDSLRLQLIILLDGLYSMNSVQDCEEFPDYLFSTYQALTESEDKNISIYAKGRLVQIHMNQEHYAQAKELLQALPNPLPFDKQLMNAKIHMNCEEIEKAAIIVENKLLQLSSEYLSLFEFLIKIAIKEEQQERASYIAEKAKQVCQLLDLCDFQSYSIPLELALQRKQVEESISLLDLVLSSFEKEQFPKDSPLYSHLYTDMTHSQEYMLPMVLKDIKENTEEYGFLMDQEKYQDLMQRYDRKEKQKSF